MWQCRVNNEHFTPERKERRNSLLLITRLRTEESGAFLDCRQLRSTTFLAQLSLPAVTILVEWCIDFPHRDCFYCLGSWLTIKLIKTTLKLLIAYAVGKTIHKLL